MWKRAINQSRMCDELKGEFVYRYPRILELNVTEMHLESAEFISWNPFGVPRIIELNGGSNAFTQDSRKIERYFKAYKIP